MRSLWIRSFFTFAVSSFQCASLRGEKAVPNKPSERDRAIVHNSAGVWSGLSDLLGYFPLEYFARFRRFHLRLQPENYRDDGVSSLAGALAAPIYEDVSRLSRLIARMVVAAVVSFVLAVLIGFVTFSIITASHHSVVR
jgi:hypothetical protein